MALGYIAINRVQSTHIMNPLDDTTKAVDIPVTTFIPDDAEFNQLVNRMGVIVGRVLTRHLKWYKDNFSNFSVSHIMHDHTLESTHKSVLINLGVFKEDPSSTQGAVGIYSKLQEYVPVLDDKPYGDGLSCERGNDAQRARTNGLNPFERLEGLEPAAQEFHKEMILLQDFYDDFYLPKSAADRGTLCQVRNMFNFRQVKPDISDNFSYAWELMCVMTEAYVCLLAMKFQEMDEPSCRPNAAPIDIEHASDEEKAKYFEDVCKLLVQQTWHKLDTDLLKHDDGTGLPVFCCGEDKNDIVIGCEARSSCLNGEYFHCSCVTMDTNDIHGHWFCSNECRQVNRKQYQYCTCKTDLGSDEPMIGCSAENLCLKEEWYHMKCIGVDPRKKIKGHWFCSEEFKVRWKGKGRGTKGQKGKSEDDFKRKYSLALVWRGLNLLCRRDAVREADGDAMMAHWKLDLVNFFAKKHPKYVILAHRLIASING